MMFSQAWALALSASSLLTGANAAATKRATPTLHLVGDSTMALHSASEGVQGWGTQIGQYLQNINLVNSARSGTSARSYSREGYWYNVLQTVVSGDYVVIEFGHNDGGSISTSDRAEVVGESQTDSQTVVLANGTSEVVYTFSHYMSHYIDDVKAKGATVIISSQTPNNPYENSDTIINSPSRFVGYAKNIAALKGVPYVDHFAAAISVYTKLGKATTESYFPNDHTHTNIAGANQVAWAFLSGLKCPAANGALAAYVNAAGQGAGARC